MFAPTVLLSSALIIRGAAQSDSVEIVIDPLEDVSTEIAMEAPNRRLEPPQMRGEGEACGRLFSGLFGRCKFGLYCKYFTQDGTSTSGQCVRYGHNSGDIDQACNYPPLAPCNYDYLAPNWEFGWCKCEPSRPSPHRQTGGPNQRCNPHGRPCNSDNLEPRYEPLYPSGEACTCNYRLGDGIIPRHSTQDQSSSPSLGLGGLPTPQMGGEGEPCRYERSEFHDVCNPGLYCHYTPVSGSTEVDGVCRSTHPKDAQSSSPSLGQRAPEMGREGEPCRTSDYYDGCDAGLYCHYFTRDGTSTEGVCRREPNPRPRPSHNSGGLNQLCNQPPVAPCNTDDLEAVWQSGRCTCEPHSNPSPRRGEAHGRCNSAPYAPCNRSNLQPHYQRLYPSGESCTCEYLLGDSNTVGRRIEASGEESDESGEESSEEPESFVSNLIRRLTSHTAEN